MGDRITLTGLRARGFHGVFGFEHQEGQDFIVDVVLKVRTRKAARTDDVADTVDYGSVARLVHARVTGEPCDLIETLADRIATDLLGMQRVRAVKVTVHKPSAPLTHADGSPMEFSDVAVTVSRSHSD